jgi:hypothetical protein
LPVDNNVLLVRSTEDLNQYKKQLEHWSGIVLQAESLTQSKDKTTSLPQRKAGLNAMALASPFSWRYS